MPAIQPRHPVFLDLRDFSLPWRPGSLAGVLTTFVSGGYARFTACPDRGLEGFFGCVAGVSLGLLAFLGPAFMALVVLAAMQMSCVAGARVRSARPQSLGVDVIDALDIDDAFDDHGD